MRPNNFCCNPFIKINHYSAKSNLRKVTEGIINMVYEYHGIIWMTQEMYICTRCRIELSSLPSVQNSQPSSSRQLQIESSPLISTSVDSPIVTPPTEGSTASVELLEKELIDYEKLKQIADILDIPIPELKSLKPSHPQYRMVQEETFCASIQQSCKMLLPGKPNDSETDLEEVILNMNSAMNKCGFDIEKKLDFFGLLPKRWSLSKIESKFEGHVTSHIKKKLSEIRQATSGITPLPVQRGRPGIKPETIEKVLQFYRQDHISRPFPGMKDVISIKQKDGTRVKLQKRLLLDKLSNLHNQYKETLTPDEEEISLSVFTKLRPKECVFAGDSSAHNVCVCVIHENTKFYIQGLWDTGCFKEHSDINDFQEKLIRLMMCEAPTEACHLQDCESCDITNMIEFVTARLDEFNIEMINFSLWVMSPQCDFTNREMEVDDFVDCFQYQLKKFIVHKFKVHKQTEFINKKKELLTPEKSVMCQLDFAENYSCEVQNAIQGVYFSKQQVTIHPIVVYYKTVKESKLKNINIIFISEVRSHNSILVYTFLKKLNEFLKKRFPHLHEILYVSDGSAEQYKNKSNFKNLCCHYEDFGVKAEWHFWPTSHGKGPCDGIGGTLKRRAREASLKATCPDQRINNAKQFFDWTQKQQDWKNWEFFYITKEHYQMEEKFLRERLSNLSTIHGTHSFHQFIPKDINNIFAKEYSGQTNAKEHELCFYLHKYQPEASNKRKADSNDGQQKTRSMKLN